MLTLKAETRDIHTKPEIVRKGGKIPAVFYGKKEASTPISIGKVEFLKVWREAGESSVVTLETPEGVKESLIQDVDLDPITGNPRHADFYVFEKGHKVEVELPLEFIGVSPAVKDLGGILVKVIHELEVIAMPKDLPHNIEVDIGSLSNFEDQILAKDIVLPQGVELKENPEEVVALVSAPREEKEEEVAPVDLSQIEVEKKGKEEETETTETNEDDKKEPPHS
ncbi:MAG: 50S ribosomal protein L25 [Candidatus Zambryskibacteria bacterium CG11_big_fil_rev_8_21_14_0_20_42_18]|uniref:Large ribosomal subunit protein bL25 n=1 Tax=Candidatus Zambryskibacteria bacterium CG_4_9_14_3_um_filter_42_15 TaxID=1975112 RepID=A0A2M7WSU3_9BACT|nr:MAG: 50S ribosomal protein L25 [Candidatus Zambryskibacteria bacterium CG11_big_fil_rev_8_21_14_0_20_42_18]PJA33081.1 MAG: 50S ribosomal protein L25 [Candidatus Zambryskibacteria bacterium CG_4_9_14_3_um_filter_42_15]